MKNIKATELKSWIDEGRKLVIIDVREPYEYEEYNIGGRLIPLGELAARIDEIPKSGTVVIHCNSGKRSNGAISYLENLCGFRNLINLEGGIQAFMAMPVAAQN